VEDAVDVGCLSLSDSWELLVVGHREVRSHVGRIVSEMNLKVLVPEYLLALAKY
jgi:hypothetical protein